MLCGHDAVTAHFTHMNRNEMKQFWNATNRSLTEKRVRVETESQMIYTFNCPREVSKIMCVG